MDDWGRISRRSLLIGGAGAVAAGGVAGVGLVGVDRVLRRLGLAESPDLHAPAMGADVRVLSLRSRAMKRSVPVGISAPDDARGVVVCLHGRGGTYKMAFGTVEMHHFVAAVEAPLAVVAVNGGLSSYWHKRKTGIDPQAMLHEELLPLIERELGRVPLAIMGWSMGGYGALLAAERNPGVYKAVIGASPALFTSAGATSPGAFDDAEDYHRNDVFASVEQLATTTVRLDCGTGDPFIGATRVFAARLPAPNVGAFSDGYHDGAYWRSVAPAQIETIREAMNL